MKGETLEEGDDVELTFVKDSGLRTGRRTFETTVLDVCGSVLTLASPFEDGGPKLVVDPEDDVWARADGTDGYYGHNAEVAVA